MGSLYIFICSVQCKHIIFLTRAVEMSTSSILESWRTADFSNWNKEWEKSRRNFPHCAPLAGPQAQSCLRCVLQLTLYASLSHKLTYKLGRARDFQKCFRVIFRNKSSKTRRRSCSNDWTNRIKKTGTHIREFERSLSSLED